MELITTLEIDEAHPANSLRRFLGLRVRDGGGGEE